MPSDILRGNLSGGDNPLRWVDKEEDEDLPMTWFSFVFELERSDGMLVDVREYKDSSGLYEWTKIVC
jgi:hypothetical protein